MYMLQLDKDYPSSVVLIFHIMNNNTPSTSQTPPQAQPALFKSFITIMIDSFQTITNDDTT